jgi:large subunit ribosomal protein L31
MKTDIHPEYKTVTVHCSCGNEFETRSTADELRVELCSECHPFYTGKQKLVDTGGRIDRFERRYGRRNKGGAAQADEAQDAGTQDAEAAPAEAESADSES